MNSFHANFVANRNPAFQPGVYLSVSDSLRCTNPDARSNFGLYLFLIAGNIRPWRTEPWVLNPGWWAIFKGDIQDKSGGDFSVKNLMRATGVAFTLVAITACTPPGAEYQANVYKANQINQVQDAKVISVLVILPAKVEVPNTQAKQTAQVIGGVLGAVAGGVLGNTLGNGNPVGTAVGVAGGAGAGVAAGSLVSDKVLVDGVTLTYVENDKTLSSTQVGRVCEYKLGPSVLISTGPNETRVQPNSSCPADTGSKS